MRIVPSEDYAGHCASAKKFSKVVSKKLEFGHLRVKGENDDDDPHAEKILEVCHLPGIIHRRVRDIINSQERRKPHGDPKQKNSTYRCHFARIFT